MKRTILCIAIAILMIITPILEDNKALAKDYNPLPAMAPTFSTQNNITIEAIGAVLMEQTTGRVLYSKNAHEILYPASTTKILTALVALENANINDMIIIGEEVKMVPSHSTIAGLLPGETYSMYDLLLAMMLPSGNDAANAIAVYIARQAKDEELDIEQAIFEFSRLMNQRAQLIGAVRSNFVNPHGCHDKSHYTTAYDLALIAREAMNNPTFKKLVSTTSVVVEKPLKEPDKSDGSDKPNENHTHKWRNSNQLLNKENNDYYFPYATGIKTGFTTPAGHCLVSSASKDGFELISVVLRDSKEGRWFDSKKLLEYGLNNYTFHEFLKKGDILCTTYINNHAENESGKLNIMAAESYRDIFNKEDIPKIQSTIVWDNDLLDGNKDDEEDDLLSAPVSKGQKLGRVVYTLNGVFIKDIDLIADRDIQEKKFLNIAEINTLPLNQYSSLAFVIGLFIICLVVFIAAHRLRTR